MDNNKTVYLLTNFSQYLKSYSPIIVVSEQLLMLKRAGYTPVLITTEGWENPPNTPYEGVKVEHLYPSGSHDKMDEIFESDVADIYKRLEEIIPENSVVITHDLIFLPDYTKHNIAARRLAEKRPSIRWLHWVHSATSPNTLIEERSIYGEQYKELLLSKFPNSIICYPNAHDIPRVARNFNFEEFEVVEVPHSTDPTEGMQTIVKRLYDEKKLSEATVLSIAPMRLDRGKNPHMIVRIQAAYKAVGLTSHVIFCNFQSTGGDKITLREECKKLAKELGVEDRVTFLSEFDDSAQLEVDHRVVLDLFTLSNVFFLPSRSETYSLVAQEAMLKGNLCFLNYDFPAFRQIYGDKALYRQFDGAEIAMDGFDGKTDTTHSNIDVYFQERIAIPTKGWLLQDKVMNGKTWVRTKRNPDYVFKTHVEPLFYQGFKDA
jgi:glycosyltransferase involved in cell wall biosynthesis